VLLERRELLITNNIFLGTNSPYVGLSSSLQGTYQSHRTKAMKCVAVNVSSAEIDDPGTTSPMPLS